MIRLDPNKIRLIAFDIDGTIFSSENIISEVYKESIEKFSELNRIHIEMPSHEEIMQQIGKPVKTIFKNLLPHLPENHRDKISDSVLQFLCERIEKGEGHFYPKVEETIRSLKEKNYAIAAASNGRRPYVETILKKSNVLSFFDDLAILNYKDLNTKGDILKYYKKKFGLRGEEILMVGDRASDRDAALDAETPFAFCSFGHATDGEIPDYSVKLETLFDIVDLLPGHI